jgi:hypothetical protein
LDQDVNECSRYQAILNRLLEEPGTAIPDDLAIHLDRCQRCRSHFDRTRLPLRGEDFEHLSPEARRRLRFVARGASRVRARWLRGIAAIAAAAVLVVTILVLTRPGPAPDGVSVAVVEDHIRYLDHADRRAGEGDPAERARLRDYVDFPVTIPTPDGATLTGARRCFLLGRRAVLLFYATRKGPASYFEFSADGLELPRGSCTEDARFACSAVHGYEVVSWKEAGLVHAFVGADRQSLQRLAASCRNQSSG